MSIYRGRRTGTWRVVIRTRGRRFEFIVEGNKKDAAAFEAREKVKLEASGKVAKRRSPTFNAFCESVYQPHAEQHLKESTWKKVRVYQVATLREHFGSLKLTDITAEAVDRFKAARTAQKRKPSAVNNELRVLRTILNLAKELKYPTTDATFRRLTERGRPRVSVWTAEEVARIFVAAEAHTPDILALLVFLANTGCRKGEALAAEWSWLDFDRGLVCIPSNEFWQPKNGKPREIPLSSALRTLLAVPEAERAHERWIFVNRRGAPYAEFPKDRFWIARAVAGLSGGPHTLRHSFASLFLAAQPDMFLLAEVLGHSHTRVTELYSHLLPQHLARARDVVNLSPPTAAPPPEPTDDQRAEPDERHGGTEVLGERVLH